MHHLDELEIINGLVLTKLSWPGSADTGLEHRCHSFVWLSEIFGLTYRTNLLNQWVRLNLGFFGSSNLACACSRGEVNAMPSDLDG